jgi:hypothetical protein
VYPVRDESKLGPHEDLDRQPDDTPDSMIALLVLTMITLALLAFVFLTKSHIDDLVALVVAIPVMVFVLARWARRHRTGAHPSR